MTPQLLLVVGGLVVLTSQILIRGTGGARIAWNLTLVTLMVLPRLSLPLVSATLRAR
jgi:hypothetical protein